MESLFDETLVAQLESEIAQEDVEQALHIPDQPEEQVTLHPINVWA